MNIGLQNQILYTTEKDDNIRKTIKTIIKDRLSNLKNDILNWKIEEVNRQKTIFYKEKKYIFSDQELQQDIVKMFHDHETAGHPGELEMYNLVKQYYLWPDPYSFVKNYMQGCGICQQFEIN